MAAASTASHSVSTAAATEALEQRGLYGGAITLDIPARFKDISALRQIPDNQEVFADVDTDQSIIIELLALEDGEPITSEPDDRAAAFHFRSLAHDNAASNTVLEHDPAVTDLKHFKGSENATTTSTLCWGLQEVAKFKEGADSANQIRVLVGCVRLRAVGTDMVISFNSPVEINSASSSAETVNQDAADAAAEAPDAVIELMKRIFGTAKIVDYGLFGG